VGSIVGVAVALATLAAFAGYAAVALVDLRDGVHPAGPRPYGPVLAIAAVAAVASPPPDLPGAADGSAHGSPGARAPRWRPRIGTPDESARPLRPLLWLREANDDAPVDVDDATTSSLGRSGCRVRPND
jgi:hypothetical protein